MVLKDYYTAKQEELFAIVNRSLKEGAGSYELFAKNHQAFDDLSLWLGVLSDRYELSIYENAFRCYQAAEYDVLMGLYQSAFFGLRYFFERLLVGIDFSTSLLEYKTWLRGDRDTYWTELVGKDSFETGLFSKLFCRAFFPEMEDEIYHFGSMAKKVYRECSEFVHGNYDTLERIPHSVSYSEALFEEWNLRADTILYVLHFTMCLRYLRTLNKESIVVIEPVLRERLRTIKSINNFLDLYHA